MASDRDIMNVPDSILIESLVFRMKAELTDMLTEKLTEEVLKPMIKEAVDKAASELEVNVNKMFNPSTWEKNIRYLIQWRENEKR